MSERLRPFLIDVEFLCLPFAVGFILALLGGYLFTVVAAAIAAVGLAVVLGVFAFYTSVDEDDWWNDFRSANRMLVLGGLASVAAPGLGLAIGLVL